MKIYYLFSRNKKIGSRLISWASGFLIKDLEKVPSHSSILIEFSEIEEKFVIESTLNSGVRIIPYSKWLEINEECYKILEIDKKLDINIVFYKLINLWGQSYDWPAFTYFSLSFIKYLLFKIPFSKTNKWQRENKYLCTEVVAIIHGYENYSMVTPAKLCSDLLKSELNGEII